MKLLPDFYTYFITKGYTKEIARYYSYNAYYYKKWLEKQGLSIPKASYKNLMDYIGYLQNEKKKSTVIINKHLRSIEHYYDYLQLANLASNVRIKGAKHHLRLFLKQEELDLLYENYTADYSKLLLSLNIYQALELQDLLLLQLQGVNLEKGTLYVPAGKQLKNGRTIPLEAHQILPLQQYILEHRDKDQKEYTSSQSELLFLPQAVKKHRLQKQLTQLHKSLVIQSKAQEASYQSLRQLRQSRIVLWIKKYGLRQAQYLSGHKGIYSIERYRQQDIEDLSKQIELFHPLG